MDSLSRRLFLRHSALMAGALGASQAWAGPLREKPLRSDRLRPVDFSQVSFTDTFWRPKQLKVATATLSACIYQTEQNTGRIRNFERAARRTGEAHQGIYFDDSDVYKALEAMAYSLK